ncbi:MAG: hypothetical protein KF857_03180 [Fimbriimonadaceae bacterium]|nr:hypothetical protein [Fimbriimonadaceae bacterium]
MSRPLVRVPVLAALATAALLGWVGYRCWDYYGRPLTEADLQSASPDRLAVGLGSGSMRDKVAAKLFESGPSGWKALVRALRSPDVYARRQAAQTLAGLRYLALESGVAAAADDTDKLARAYKIAALAANGGRKSMPYFVAFAKEVGRERHLSPSQQFAVGRVASLMASINTPEALSVLLDLVPTGDTQVVFALTDFDAAEARSALDSHRAAMDLRQRLQAELRVPGDADPAVKALALSITTSPSALDALTPDQLKALAQGVPTTSLEPGTPAYAALLAGQFLGNPRSALDTSADAPDLGLQRWAPVLEKATPKTAAQDLDELLRVNGLVHAAYTGQVTDKPSLVAMVRSDPGGAVPRLRALVRDPRRLASLVPQARLELLKLSTDPADIELVNGSVFPVKGPHDATFVETVLRLPGGASTLVSLLASQGTTDLDLTDMLSALRKVPSSLVTTEVRRAAVAAAKRVAWQDIRHLDPAWCREFGDDDTKEKYALLLGNNRYADRIAALRYFAASGHKLIGDELKLTSGRGMVDETVACVEVVGENRLTDQLPFVLAKLDDPRWRVREAVAYTLRLLDTPESATGLLKLRSDPNKAVSFTASDPRFAEFHLQLNGRRAAGPDDPVAEVKEKPRISAMPGPLRMTDRP